MDSLDIEKEMDAITNCVLGMPVEFDLKALMTLKAMCVDYFTAVSSDKIYARTPSLALRLPVGDFLVVIKPTTKHFNKMVTVDNRGVIIECLVKLDERKSSKWLTLLVTDEIRKLSWMRNKDLTNEAIEAVNKVTALFIVDPQVVIQRNKDNCCCCGKGLVDEVSRARGIGPECELKVSKFLLQLLAT